MADGSDAPKTYALPDGYEDVDEFLAEARERFQAGVDFDRENRDQGLEDLKFLAGEQWDDEAKRLRAGRPMLTINTLPQNVAQVVGDIRINRPGIKVRPAEGGDKDLAEIREGLIRAIERENDAQGVYASTGTNQVGCGIGNFRIGLKYATDDGFDRDITIEAIPNAFAVVWDPMSAERTGKDAGWCFVSDQMPRKAFERLYGTKTASGLEVPLHDVAGWYQQDVVRVTEYWLIKHTPTKLALLEGGHVVPIDEVPQGAKVLKSRTVQRRSACMYLISGQQILDGPYELPIDRVPIIRVPGWEINVGEKRVRWGLVRFARDPARLRNYWRSISAEMLALMPKGKWLLHETQDGRQDDFRDAHQADDPILTWNGAVKPEYIAPPTLNTAVLQESALNAQDIKDVTGQHDASLGAKSNETSGKAIMARQREGDVATYIYPDNLHAAIGEGGRVINQLIPVVFDTARTIRTVGEDETSKVQQVNDPTNPESVDINQGKYDTVVETGPSYSTKRVEAAESMMQFVQAVPAAAAVAGDLIAKVQDWPMADQIGERLQKTLPPNILAKDPADMTPEEKQAAAEQQQQHAQQMQAQQQGVALDLREREAGVKLKEAQAMKAFADARSTGAPHAPDGPDPLDLELKRQQVRKASADADAAAAAAGIAFFELSKLTNPATAMADAVQAEQAAHQSVIKTASDFHALTMKPLEVQHSQADLEAKLNPPEPDEPDAPAEA